MKLLSKVVLAFIGLTSIAMAEPVDLNSIKAGEDVYVADNITVWTRRGPSTEYKVIGTQKVGDKLTFIQKVGDYVKVKNEDDNEVWIAASNLSAEVSGYNKVKLLNDKIESLQYKLDNFNQELTRELNETKEALNKANSENQSFKKELEAKEATIAKLDELRIDYLQQLETKELDMQMRWWLQGALIAFFGALFGVILVFIPRPSRKKKHHF